MDTCYSLLQSRVARWIGAAFIALFALVWLVTPKATHAENERVVTIFHDDIQQTVVTDASTIEEALKRANVSLEDKDTVEPARDTPLTAPSYDVNVYRAKPVTVIDGANRHQIMSAHTSARQIAADAGITLHSEDNFTFQRINDFIAEGGVGLKMNIERATPVNFVLYGKATQIRTQTNIVGELLKEKQVVLASEDGTNVSLDTPIKEGMIIEVWRNGAQTITEEQPVAFPVELIRDADKPAGFRQIQTPGTNGKKMVTYQVELKDGQTISRKEIQSMVTEQPKKQVEIIGVKSSGGLSESKGVYMFTDSKGVVHRETYYDLVMNGVMGFCGGGTYSVRADGAKVDQAGYIIIAANLSRYPRCSVVETSLGAAKVYDTGGFASRHPDGYDLATDWSNNDGR